MRLVLLALILTLMLVPVVAQETTPELTPDATAEATATVSENTFTYEGISFTLDPAFWSEVNVVPFAGDDPTDALPGFADAAHVQFMLLTATPSPESRFDGEIRVYRFDDLIAFPFIVNEVNALGALVNTPRDLSEYMLTTPNAHDYVLPFLPVQPDAQMIRARAEYLETDALTGIRYLTVFQSAAAPFTGSEVLYTFQGLNIEAQVYVSVAFRLNTTLFPVEADAVDMDEFVANLQPYFAGSIATLNAAANSDFTPSLDVLDALVQSITISE